MAIELSKIPGLSKQDAFEPAIRTAKEKHRTAEINVYKAEIDQKVDGTDIKKGEFIVEVKGDKPVSFQAGSELEVLAELKNLAAAPSTKDYNPINK